MKDILIVPPTSDDLGFNIRKEKDGSVEIWHDSIIERYIESVIIPKKAIPKVIEFLNECQKS